MTKTANAVEAVRCLLRGAFHSRCAACQRGTRRKSPLPRPDPGERNVGTVLHRPRLHPGIDLSRRSGRFVSHQPFVNSCWNRCGSSWWPLARPR